jgi:hypothetical protein
MNAQLQEITDELRGATTRLHRLRDAVPADRWTVRNDPSRWSISECVAHLNLTSAAFVPLLRAGIEEARRTGTLTRRYRKGFLGWALWKMTGPEARGRMRTTPSFDPTHAPAADAVITDFEQWQEVLVGLLAASDGLPIDRVEMTSPFNARMRYNLYAGFSTLPRHQHRHLQQAERVWAPAG